MRLCHWTRERGEPAPAIGHIKGLPSRPVRGEPHPRSNIMTDEKTPSDVLSDLVNVPFPNAAYLDSMKRVISVQKQMLDGFQDNLDKWFERRREGAEATMTMLSELNGTTDHDQRAEAWQRWVSGTMARIMDDVQTQFDLMSRITNQLAQTGEVAMPAEPETPVTATKNVSPLFKDGTVRPRPPQTPRRK